MADEVLDTLKIKVSAETDEAEKKITALANAIQTAFNGRGSTKTGEKLKSISEAANGINENASSNVQGLATALGTLGGVKISATIATQLTRIGAALKSIDGGDIAKLKDLTSSIGAINASGGVGNIKVQQPKTPTREIKENIKPTIDTKDVAKGTDEIKHLGEVISDVAKEAQSEKIAPDIDLKAENANRFITFLESLAIGSRAISAIGSGAKTAFSVVKGAISTALPYAKKLASAFTQVSLAVGKGVGKVWGAPFLALGKAISGATTRLKGFLTRIGRIALYRAIRSAIKEITQGFKEGIDNAYEWSKINGGQLAKSMNSLATSAQYVKNSLGAMAAPLLNALAPAIDYVADKLVALINLFNQVFAKFTGASTWMRAKKQAVEYEGAANSATKATKKFKATILGIDEINPLQDNSDNGGGGGGGGADYGSMFEEVPVDSSIADFVQDIKDAIDAGDWEGVGSLISDKLVYAMDQIDWNAVYAKADKFGVNFASFLNGLFETKIDPKTGEKSSVFTAVAQTVAGALNTAFNAFDKFGETFNFDAFGSGIADGVIKFFQTIDWETALSSIKNWGTGVANAINSFLSEQDENGNTAMSSIGSGIGDLINGGIEWFSTTTGTIHWDDLGTQVGTMIINALKDIKWDKFQQGAKDLGKGLATSLNKLFEIKDEDGHGAAYHIGVAIKNFIMGAINGFNSFVTSIDKETAKQAIEDFFTGLDWKSIKDSFKTLVANALSTIGSITVDAIKFLVKDTLLDENGKLKASDILGKIQNVLVGLSGAVAGFVITKSPAGALIGFALATLVSFAATSNSGNITGLSGASLSSMVQTALVGLGGAVAGFAITKNPTGALIGFSVATLINFAATKGSGSLTGLDASSFSNRIIDALVVGMSGALVGFQVGSLLGGNAVAGAVIGFTLTATFSFVFGQVGTIKGVRDQASDFLKELCKHFGINYDESTGNSTVNLGEVTVEQNSVTSSDKNTSGFFGGLMEKLGFKSGSDKNKSTASPQVVSFEPLSYDTSGTESDATAAGKEIGGYIESGAESHGYGGIADQVKTDLTSKDSLATINSGGKTAGREIAKGAKSHGFQGIVDKLNKDLKSKDAKEAYGAAGGTAAASFANKFKPYIPTLKVNAEGKFEIKHVYLSPEAKKELQGIESVHTSGGGRQTKAEGGFVKTGQVFIANENGIPPEYIGSIGNRTAVANTDQIVEGISSGVYAANQEQNALLRQQNALLQQLLAKDTGGGGQVTVSSIVTGVDRYNRRAGKTVMATA